MLVNMETMKNAITYKNSKGRYQTYEVFNSREISKDEATQILENIKADWTEICEVKYTWHSVWVDNDKLADFLEEENER